MPMKKNSVICVGDYILDGTPGHSTVQELIDKTEADKRRYGPLLTCSKEGIPTKHTFVKAEHAGRDKRTGLCYEHVYACLDCGAVRRWGLTVGKPLPDGRWPEEANG